MKEEIKFLDSIQQLVKKLSEKISPYKIAKALEMYTPMIYKIVKGEGGTYSLSLLTKVKKFGYIPAIVFIPVDDAKAYQAVEAQNKKALEDIKNKILEDVKHDEERREMKKAERKSKPKSENPKVEKPKTEETSKNKEIIHEVKPVTEMIKNKQTSEPNKEEEDIFSGLEDIIN